MAIEDSNPERRNLVVLSMAIIAFYFGGCEIPPTGEIELPLIKLKFTDAYHLAWLIWITLSWFAFRYFIESKAKIINSFHSELNGEAYLRPIFARLFFNKIDEDKKIKLDPESFRYQSLVAEDSKEVKGVPLFVVFTSGEFDDTGQWKAEHVRIRWLGLLLYPLLIVRVMLIKPSLSANAAPLVIFLIAVGFGLNGASAKKPVENYYLDINKFLVQAGESSNELKSAICE